MAAPVENPVNQNWQRFGKPGLLYCGAMPRPAPHGCPPNTPLGNARGLADGIAGTLRMARALIASGRSIELAGLEGPVGLLCAKSLDLPPEQGRRMRVVLAILLQEVDAMSETIRATPDGAGRMR